MLKINALLIMCFFTLFFSCKDDVNTTFEDINITTENNSIVEVNIPKAIGNQVVSSVINSEIEKQVIANLHLGEPNTINAKSIEESVKNFNEEFETFQIDFPETSQSWEAQIDGEIMFTSIEIISLALTSYINTGGAHGMLKVSFLNFDAATGKIIPNKNLINNTEAFKEIALPYFKEAIKDKDIFEPELEAFELPENMGYNDEGIVLLYNAYEIAPYSTGIIEFEIPFNEIESYLAFNSTR